MDKYSFIKFLHKYRKGDFTKEEQQFLISYYNLFDNEPDVIDILTTEKKNEIKNEIKENIWDNISKDEQPYQKIRFINRRFIKMTAVAATFLGFTISLVFLFNGLSKKRAPASLAVQQPSGLLKKQVAGNPIAQHKENRVLFLPDGSTVTLSPGSKLNYPSSFDGMKKREVFLYGQAFFDIKHNVSRPFIVHTAKLETIVLGTAFNIKAMPDETDITVTVKRGKVKVSDQNKTLGVITPNQQITYNLRKVSSTMKILDGDSYLDWKEQDLLLDNLTVAEAAKLLEERYKVKIIINEPSLGSQRFTTTFKKDESFEQVLKSICVFNGVVYKYNKEKTTVIISIN
ncbi:MAG: FecR domain-containing protein [Ginsengibacter sp.]